MSVLGPELVTNGAFATDSDWTKGTDWTINGGTADYLNTQGQEDTSVLSQSISVTSGQSYYISIDLVSQGIGVTMQVSIGGGVPLTMGLGVKTGTIVAGSSDQLLAFSVTAPDGKGVGGLDNVSVKAISAADTIEKAVYDILRIDSTVSGLVSSRIYPQVIPQNTSLPAIAYNIIAAPRGHHFDGMTDLVPARFQLSIYAQTYAELRALVDAVRGALDSVQNTAGTVYIASSLMIDENDLITTTPGVDQFRLYGRALDFRITYRES